MLGSFIKQFVITMAVGVLGGCNNVLLTNPIGTSATLVNAPFENKNSEVNLLVYVGDPHVILERKQTSSGQALTYTFYQWIYNAFAIYGDDIYLVNGSYAANRAAELGLNTSSIQFADTFIADSGSAIRHLNFRDSDLKKLRGLAAETGVTHIVKATLTGITTNDSRHEKQYRYLNSNSRTMVEGYIHRSNVSIHVTVFDQTLGRNLFEKNYDFYEELQVISPYSSRYGHARHSGTLRKSVVDSILDDIDQRTRQVFSQPVRSSRLEINYPVKYKITGKQESPSGAFDLSPQIASIERNSHSLRFNLIFRNKGRRKLSLDLSSTKGRTNTFIINGNREVFWASRSNLMGGTTLAPSQEISFYLDFPHKGGDLGNVNLQTTWELGGGYGKPEVTLMFTELETP